MSLSDRRRTMLEAAASEAKRFGHVRAGPLHLALALGRRAPLDAHLGPHASERLTQALRHGESGAAEIDLASLLAAVPEETPEAVLAALAPLVRRALAGPPAPAPEADDEVPLLWSVGDVILGTYEVLGVAGEGGMGRVYRVRHRHWDVELAVKSPRPDCFVDDHDQGAFEAEAQRWIGLGLHPHICTCHYVRRLGGIPRVFAEFADGGSLADWIRDGRLYDGEPLERMLAIAVQFARGLAFAHARGVVHQDVKPGNVLLSQRGEAKVADFGIARAATGSVSAVADVRVSLGGMTPAYRSPEQAAIAALHRAGQPAPRLTPTTDTWSFAVALLEMFLGELPGPDGQAAGRALDAYRRAGSRGPVQGVPPMPGAVAELLARCLRADPATRPAMEDAAQELATAFEATTGTAFAPDSGDDDALLAGELSNRALSMLDLGRPGDAADLWARALERDPHHPQATYNRALAQWRSGAIADDEVARRMEAVRGSHGAVCVDEHLSALFELERGDPRVAMDLLDEAGPGDDVTEARRAADTTAASARREHALGWELGRVDALALTPDGRRVLLGSQHHSGLAQLVDADAGRVLQTLTTSPGDHGPRAAGTPVALSADGRLAMTGCLDGTIAVWGGDSGMRLRAIRAHMGNVGAVVLAPDGRYAMTWAMRGDEPARTWDLRSGRCVGELTGMGMVTCAALDAASGRILAGGPDGLRLRDPARGAGIVTLGAPNESVLAVAIDRGGRHALTGGADGALRLWDLDRLRLVRELAGHSGSVLGVALTADGAVALSGGLDTTARLWDLREGRCRRTLQAGAGVTAVALTPDGRRGVTGTAAGTAAIWRLDATASRRAPWAYTRPRAAIEAMDSERRTRAELAGVDALIEAGDLSAAGARLRELRAVAGYERHPDVLARWRAAIRHGRRASDMAAVQVATLAGKGSGELKGIALTADGRHAVSVGGAAAARLWDLERRREVASLQGPRYGWSDDNWMSALQTAVAISRDGPVALIGSFMGAVQVWDLETGECRHTLLRHDKAVTAAAVTPDGRLGLTSGEDGLAVMWDLATGAELRTFDVGDRVTSLTLAADGERALTTARGQRACLWSLPGGTRLGQLSAGEAACAALAAEGTLALIGGAGGAVHVWDFDRTELAPAGSHDGPVVAAALSRDGGVALTAGADRTARVWDLAGRAPPRALPHGAAITGVALSADGRVAVTAGGDGAARIWELDWEYDFPEPADWDERAAPLLDTFLRAHVPYAQPLHPGGPLRRGAPIWDAADAEKLLRELEWAGLGFLRRDAVLARLDERGTRHAAPAAPPAPAPAPASSPPPQPQPQAVAPPDDPVVQRWTDEQAKEHLDRHATTLWGAISGMLDAGLDEAAVSVPVGTGAQPSAPELWIAFGGPHIHTWDDIMGGDPYYAWLVPADALLYPSVPQPAGATIHRLAMEARPRGAAGLDVALRGDLPVTTTDLDAMWRALCVAIEDARTRAVPVVKVPIWDDIEARLVAGIGDPTAPPLARFREQLRHHYVMRLSAGY